jgi:hypothetical protein
MRDPERIALFFYRGGSIISLFILFGGFMKKFALALSMAALVLALAAAAPAKSLDSYWTDKGASYPASGTFAKPAAWTPGQYVTIGTIVKGKKDAVTTTLLVRKEEGSWVIENSAIDKKGKQSVSQMCLKGFDEAMATGDTSKIELVWMKSLDKDGKVSVIEGPAIKMMKSLMKSSWEKLVVTVSSPTDGGAQAVPAGNFAGTSFIKSTSKIMGKTIEMETWYHPSVPVNGMVKTRSADGSSESVLLAFGVDGKSQLP